MYIMKRKIYHKLITWKNSIYRKPLLLKGVRQVGKSYILEEFGKNEFHNLWVFNFEKEKNIHPVSLSNNAIKAWEL